MAQPRFFYKRIITNWPAVIGPNIKTTREMKNGEQIYQKQIAQTIANLVGENFQSDRNIAPAIALK